ncbi:unnamed protein product [Rhizoctonia solani]|uniref:BTB domain-containing protein n=1 Tax=Rhizoctonia solani TaxID=456999 RepID=A0A8H3BPX0_9AGAM|nr:unnamed protein product [Rhizoctonia solani]
MDPPMSGAECSSDCTVRHMNDQYEPSTKKPATNVLGKDVILDTPRIVDMGHGDIALQANGTVFITHKHILCKFSHFETMLQNAGSHESTGLDPSIILHRDEHGVEDISNTFKILYATVIDGPFHFEPTILVSALRISTAYDFPNLRNYAIRELEKACLGAIQRIQIAREFDLASWEAPAYSELSKRETPLTQEEAEILGFSAFAMVAQAREEESLRRGKTLGKQEIMKEIKLGHEKIKKKRDEERARKIADLRVKRKAGNAQG